MDLTGKTVTLCDGSQVLASKKLGEAGAQGQCYLAKNLKTGVLGVLKQFTGTQDKRAVGRRTKFLCDAKLYDISPLLARAPKLWFGNDHDGWGHWSALAPGKELNALIATGTFGPPFPQLVQLALAVATAIRQLHSLGYCHGDLHGDNLFVHEDGDVLQAALIDFDNYWATRMPDLQGCLGQIMFLAPEVRLASEKNINHPVDEFAERYSLGVLLHQILLLRHPNHTLSDDPVAFHKAMLAGEWESDPLSAKGTNGAGGYPVNVLSTTMISMLRKALGVNRENRPSAADWEAVLTKALFEEIYPCPTCGNFCVADVTKQRCIWCGCDFPGLGLRIREIGQVIPVELGGIRIGRKLLGGDPRISTHHANIERVGPAFYLRCFGTNGVFRQSPTGLVRLPDNEPILVMPKDVLAFANAVVVELVELPAAA